MTSPINITSKRAEKQAVKLAQDIQKLCTDLDINVVACALMGLLSSLPPHLAAQVCMTVAAAHATKGPMPHGNDDPQSA